MLKVFKDQDALLSGLADFVVAVAKESVAKQGRFTLALSGGSSPKKLYELLASDRYRSSVAWEHVFFFFGDERFLPLDHADSNFRMARQALFAPLGIKEDHIFAVNTALAPEAAAADYEQKIKKHFNGECRFDLVLLGLGDNSHTASLFPYTSVLSEKVALVKGIFVPEVNMFRITFTAPLINLSHRIAFLVFGKGKAEAVHHILEDPLNVEEYPAQLIKPDQGELLWFLDTEAASRISQR